MHKILGILLSISIIQCQAKEVKPSESNSNPQYEELRELLQNSPSTNGNNVNFVASAALSTPCVVHIKSKVSITSIYRSPFSDFFGDDFFDKPKTQTQQRESSGSGVIINKDGYIVTNYHVIQNATEIEVILRNKNTYKASLIGQDKDTDLALLKIEESELPFMNFANSDDVKVGEWVLAVGNPFNLESTVTQGIVSAKGRSLNMGNSTKIESFIQTDAAVNPGNSGGALVNLKGELIGINTAIASPTGAYAGYAFAVPSNIVKKVVDDLKKYKTVQRAYLGITALQMNSNLAKELNIPSPNGVLIKDVIENSAADDGGLESRDVIVAIDDIEVFSFPELLERISTHSPGDNVKVDFYRNGTLKTITTVLKNKNNSTKIIKSKQTEIAKLGIKVRPLSKRQKANYGIASGVLIEKMSPNGIIGQSTKIKSGFVILNINDIPINTMEDIGSTLKSNNHIEGFYPGQQYIIKYNFKM